MNAANRPTANVESNDSRAALAAAPRGGTGSPALECLRRAILFAGIAAAVWTAFRPADSLWRVGVADFAAMHKKHLRTDAPDPDAASPTSRPDLGSPVIGAKADPSLEQFISEKTRDRSSGVHGQAWEQFFGQVRDTQTGQSQALARHLGHNLAAGYLYFARDQRPLAQLVDVIDAEHAFRYVAVGPEGTGQWLEVLRQGPADTIGKAPGWLAYPHRHWTAALFLIALAGYSLLPWPRPMAQTLCFRRGRSVVVPDLLGAALFAVFFALPFLIIASNSPGSRPFRLLDFDYGWAWLTIILWAFAAGFLSIAVVSTHYATSAVMVLPDRLRRVTFFGWTDLAYSDMTGVSPAVRGWPRWLKSLVFFFALFNPRLMGSYLIASSQRLFGLAIQRPNGPAMKVWIDNLANFRPMFWALEKAGVPLDAPLAQAIREDMDENPAPPATRASRPVVGWVLLLAVAAVVLAWHFWPTRPAELPQQIKDLPALSPAVIARKIELLQERQDLLVQVEQAMKASKNGPVAQQAAQLRLCQDLLARFAELEDELKSLDTEGLPARAGPTEPAPATQP